MGASKNILGMLLLLFFVAQSVRAAGPALPTLGGAGSFTVLAKTPTLSTGGAAVVGDIGISPCATSCITGFGSLPLTDATTGEYATSPLVTGKVYGSDMVGTGAGAGITPTMLTTATTDMYTAYTVAQGVVSPAPVVNAGAGELAGLTLTPGVYKFSESDVDISSGGTLYLTCTSPSDTFIFQIPYEFTMESGATVHLSTCLPQNIYWAVGTQVVTGTTTDLPGIVLAGTLISISGTLEGKALAQGAVTLLGTTGTAVTSVSAPSPTTTIPPSPTTTISPSPTTTILPSPTTTISPQAGGAPQTSQLILADNINSTVIPGNSTMPVLTVSIGSASGLGNFTTKQYYHGQLPITLTLQQNQIANLSFACSFVINGVTYSFANNIYGVGYSARCGNSYTAYGGSFAGIYTAATANKTVPIATPVILPVILPVVVPTTQTVVVKTLPFPWLGNGYYEIPLGGTNLPPTGMKPGVAYWVSNRAFIEGVNSWLE